jgi:hypothetical protein
MQTRKCRANVGAAVAAALAIGAGIGIAGCAIDSGDPAERQIASALGGQCPDFGCGANSPEIEAFSFHELNLAGRPNAEGFRIDSAGDVAQIFVRGDVFDLRVTGNRITAVRGATVLTGADLVGAVIPIIKGERRYKITIRSARDLPFFLGSTTDSVGAYTLEWSSASDDEQSTRLCNNITLLESQILAEDGRSGNDNPGPFAVQELMGLRTFETVVFEGDRVDKATMTMNAKASDDWINIGCAGHTLSKLLLTRNTVHTQGRRLPARTAHQHRQATLKMLVADYCGAGMPLTVAGQKLVWQGDLMTYFHAPGLLEARWTDAGATCVSAPRMLFPSSAFGAAEFPDIWGSIKAACKTIGRKAPPPCPKPDDLFDFFGHLRISANPK